MPAAVVEQKKSIWAGMSIPIIGLTGGKGSGKSTWVSTIDPENTCMIDLEKSTQTMGTMFTPDGSDTLYGIPYKKRVDLYDELLKTTGGRPPTALDCFLWFKGFIENVKPGEFTVVAVDPISDIEAGLQQWVYDNAEEFGKTKQQYDKFGGLIHGDIAHVWKLMLGTLAAKCQTFAFTTHEGLVWKDGKPVVGKVKAKGKPVLYELASLYIKLERKPNQEGFIPDIPTGFTSAVNGGKERLSLKKMENGRVKIVQTIPPTIRNCDPESIREFIRNPVGLRALRPDEMPVPEDQRTEDDRRDQKSTDLENAVKLEELRIQRLDIARKAAARNQQSAANVAASPPAETAESPAMKAAKEAAAKKVAKKAEKATDAAATKEEVSAVVTETKAVETKVETKTEPAAVATEAKTEVKTEPAAEVKPVETKVADPIVETKSVETKPTESDPVADAAGITSTIWIKVKKQLDALKSHNPDFTDAAIAATLNGKYKKSTVDGLTKEQADELYIALRGKLSKLGLNPDGDVSGN